MSSKSPPLAAANTFSPTPPITPPKKSPNLFTALADPELVPADLDIPDNYVTHTLKTQKALPPFSWKNWYNELNWLNVAILTLTPLIGVVGAWYTQLRWETALFSVFYYYVTGLGGFLFFSLFFCLRVGFLNVTTFLNFRHHGGVSQALGPSFVQCVQTAAIFPRHGGRWRSRGLHQVVVARTPCAPPVHGHGPGPV